MLTDGVILCSDEQGLPRQLQPRFTHCQSSSKSIACLCCQLSAIVHPALARERQPIGQLAWTDTTHFPRSPMCCCSARSHNIPPVADICLQVRPVLDLDWLQRVLAAAVQQAHTPVTPSCGRQPAECCHRVAVNHSLGLDVVLVPGCLDSCAVPAAPCKIGAIQAGAVLQMLRQHGEQACGAGQSRDLQLA